jgi:serine/threonine-protein kinase HipA
VDKNRLIQWVVFNVLIGNNDAHGKNISFLLSHDGVRLAPFYDLLSTAVYPGLSQNLAMRIGGENRAEWLARRHWERMAAEANVSPRAIIDAAGSMLSSWGDAFTKTQETMPDTTSQNIIGLIKVHSDKSIRHLKSMLFE